ncbi:MAG: glycosyltransferase family protein [Acidimicrobiales bacterium]
MVTVNDPLAEELARDHRVAVDTLPQGFVRSPGANNPPCPRGDRLWLVHTGTISEWASDIRPLLRALIRVAGSGAVIGLRLVDRIREAPSELAEAVRLGFVDLISELPHTAARQYIREADVAVLVRSLAGRIWVTAKLWDYLGEGTPILALADPASECARIAKETESGWVVPYWDEKAIGEMLVDLHRRWRAGNLTPAGNQDRLAAYKASSIAGRLATLLDGLVTRERDTL